MNHEILVVKIGGGAGLDLDRCLHDIAHIARHRPVVIVHGVSAAMDALCAERGVTVRTLTSPEGHISRYTDPATRDLFVEAAMQVNAEIIQRLNANGLSAVSVDAAINGQRKAALRAIVDGRRCVIRDDYSGTICGVDSAPVLAALNAGQIPVLPPLAMSADGALNIDGDRGAAAVAGALGAGELIILSNVRGLYRNFPDESSFVSRVIGAEIDSAMGWAQGRMKRKVLAASEALSAGASGVIIADGRIDQPLQTALNGEGTTFTR